MPSQPESHDWRSLSYRQRVEDDLVRELLAAEYEMARVAPEGREAARREFLKALGRFNRFVLDGEGLEPSERTTADPR